MRREREHTERGTGRGRAHRADAELRRVYLQSAGTRCARLTTTGISRVRLNRGSTQVYRSVQYLARFLAWYYAKQGFSKELVAQMSALKSALGTTRKGEELPN